MTAYGVGFGMLLAGVLVPLGGCVTAETTRPTVLPKSRDTSLNLKELEPEPPAHVSRSQKPDSDHTMPPLLTPQTVQTTSAQLTQPETPALPTPSSSSLPTPPSESGPAQAQAMRARFTVRAYVNSEPIFDDEILPTTIAHLAGHGEEWHSLDDAGRKALFEKLFKEELNHQIETELIWQDAMRKLSKNEKFLKKLKEEASKLFDKNIQERARQLKMTVEEVQRKIIQQSGKEGWENAHRMNERKYIAGQYTQSRIWAAVQDVTHKHIRDVYDKHPEQYRTVDKVKWQDIFILVGDKHATMADARRFGEQILDAVRRGQSFDEFLTFDEGDSWRYRKGEGYGQYLGRGEIRPAELEPTLASMHDGEIRMVELTTGVHVFRVLKREYAGQMPFDEKVQQRISMQLKSRIAEREYKQLIKDLRERAVIQIIEGYPNILNP